MISKSGVLIIFIQILLLLRVPDCLTEERDFSADNELVLKQLNAKHQRHNQTAESTSGQLEGLLNEVKVLKRIISKIEQRNELEEKINQCTSSIQRRNEEKAHKHWKEILSESDSAAPAQLTKLLRKIVIDSYAGTRENILPVLSFINFTQVFTGLYGLMGEMRDYGHIYGGTEIFYIASLIRENCGKGSRLYAEVPIGVQYVDSSRVQLLSEKNQGLLVYKSKSACKGRFCTWNEIFTYHLPLESLGPELQQLRTLWTFRTTNENTGSTPTTFALIPPSPMNPRFLIVNDFNGTHFLNVDLEIVLSPIKKSIFVLHLVNGSEDVIRIRYEQSHLVRKLLMAEKYLGNTFTPIRAMGAEDRSAEANDGNWIVIPEEALGDNELAETDNGTRRRRQNYDEGQDNDHEQDDYSFSSRAHASNFPVICDI